jgi:hypothetical protein
MKKGIPSNQSDVTEKAARLPSRTRAGAKAYVTGSRILWKVLGVAANFTWKIVDSIGRIGRFFIKVGLTFRYLPRTPAGPGPLAGVISVSIFIMKRISFALVAALLVSTHAEDALHIESYVVPEKFFDRVENLEPGDARFRAALEKAGIEFPEGATVHFDPLTKRMDVRATAAQQEQIQKLLRTTAVAEYFVTVQFEEIAVKAEEVGKLEEIKLPSWDPATFHVTGPPPGVHLFASGSYLVEAMRRERVVKEETNPVVGSGINGVFTDRQYADVRDHIQKAGYAVLTAPLAKAKSGQAILVEKNQTRWGAVPVAGEDGFTVDLSLYLPTPGGVLDGTVDAAQPTAQLSLWDGQTVSWTEKRKNGDLRLVFATVRLVDREGKPFIGSN